MASIRRTLSPVPRAGTAMNGEACLAGSPLSRSSNCSLSSAPLDSQAFVLGVFSPKNPRPAEKPKHNKPQPWKRPIVQFSACFVLGIILGFTPFLSSCLAPKHQAFSFETAPKTDLERSFESSAVIYKDVTGNGSSPSKLEPRKLLIIVTPTQPCPSQAYRLNRLSHTLRLVPAPVMWIVVEMTAQSSETASVLRKTGVMYRHLVCNDVNVTGDTSAHQRNVALKHIETHRLDGIVYFADDENVYSTDLFDQLRQIRRFGIWKVAKVVDDDEQNAILNGPVCNGTEVIGWHVNEPYRRYQRFYAEMSGFAFNSTLLWDTERWHRPMLEPIRHRDKLKDNALQVSSFIEQIVEDESQMEGLMGDCSRSRIMVWHARLESADSVYPRDWVLKENLDAIASLSSSSS